MPKVLAAVGEPEFCWDPKWLAYWQTDLGDAFAKYRLYVVCHFWRANFDSTYPFWRLPRQPKSLGDQVRAEAQLWAKTLAMVERLHTLGALPYNPAVMLGMMAKQGGLLLANFRQTADPLAATKGIQQIQHQNKVMADGGNPFDAIDYPATALVIDAAVATASKLDQFHTQFYLPMVKARGGVAQLLRASHATGIHLAGDGTCRISKNGRRPKSRTRQK